VKPGTWGNVVTADPVVVCTWDGDAFVPKSAVWKRRANDAYVVGVDYIMEPKEERSERSHRHYFAAIREAFMNLPEEAAERFANQEALRKFALIKTGYRDERSIVCASRAEAARWATFIRPMDEFSIVVVIEATVTVFTAKSQSRKAMGPKDFQESKVKVLDYIGELLGTDAKGLMQAGDTG
jgi:hypothetical protein